MKVAPSERKHVLVVDDEPDYAELLATFLRDGGYEVSVAGDGARAEEAVREQRPDAITLDIQMPRKGGVRFFREIKSDPAYRDLPVIVVTGLTAGDRDMESFIHAFLDVEHLPMPEAYLEKPVTQRQLLEALRGALAPAPTPEVG